MKPNGKSRINRRVRTRAPKRDPKNVKKRTFGSIFKRLPVPWNIDIPEFIPAWRIVGSGVRGFPTECEVVGEIVNVLRSHGIDVTQSSMGSPSNADSYHLKASFLDGGIRGKTGNYWYEPRGSWVYGKQVLTFIVFSLKLEVSRKQTKDFLACNTNLQELTKRLRQPYHQGE